MSQTQFNKRDLAIHDLYTYVDGAWKRYGWRCSLCDRTFKTEKTVGNHLNTCREINTSKKEKEMPIQVVTKNGERYYRYGDTGKLYKDRKDAEKQEKAVYASGYKEPNKDMKKDK
jgi:uncharacterized C2H2 Zn-finger protein